MKKYVYNIRCYKNNKFVNDFRIVMGETINDNAYIFRNNIIINKNTDVYRWLIVDIKTGIYIVGSKTKKDTLTIYNNSLIDKHMNFNYKTDLIKSIIKELNNFKQLNNIK